MDTGDRNHGLASTAMRELLAREGRFVTSSFVVVETCSLLQRRAGIAAVQRFRQDIMPVLRVELLGRDELEGSLDLVLSTGKRDLSLVDCTSFILMRRLGISDAFVFDPHFADHGFACRP